MADEPLNIIIGGSSEKVQKAIDGAIAKFVQFEKVVNRTVGAAQRRMEQYQTRSDKILGRVNKALVNTGQAFEGLEKAAAKTAEEFGKDSKQAKAAARNVEQLGKSLGVAGRQAKKLGDDMAEGFKKAEGGAKRLEKQADSLVKGGINRVTNALKAEEKALKSTTKATAVATGVSKKATAQTTRQAKATKLLVNPLGRARKAILDFRTAIILLSGAAGGQAVVKFASDFELALANVDTLLDNSAVSIGRYREQLDALAKVSSKKLIDLTAGLYQTISAGIPQVDGAAGAFAVLEQAQRAAVAGISTTEQAVGAFTTILNAYADTGITAAEVSDKLFQTVRKGRTTFPQLADSVGRVATVANRAGVGLDELLGSVVSLTKAGLSTDEAITQLRRLILGLLKPAKNVQDQFQSLGIDFGEAALKAKGLSGILEQITVATNGSADAFAQLFPNVRAMVGAVVLGGTGLQEFKKNIDFLKTSVGATDAAFKKIQKTFDTTFKIFKSRLQSVLIRAGTRILPLLTRSFNALGAALVKNEKRVEDFVEMFAEGTVAIGKFLTTQAPQIIRFLKLFIGFFLVKRLVAFGVALKALLATIGGFVVKAGVAGAAAGTAFGNGFSSSLAKAGPAIAATFKKLLTSPALIGAFAVAGGLLVNSFLNALDTAEREAERRLAERQAALAEQQAALAQQRARAAGFETPGAREQFSRQLLTQPGRFARTTGRLTAGSSVSAQELQDQLAEASGSALEEVLNRIDKLARLTRTRIRDAINESSLLIKQQDNTLKTIEAEEKKRRQTAGEEGVDASKQQEIADEGRARVKAAKEALQDTRDLNALLNARLTGIKDEVAQIKEAARQAQTRTRQQQESFNLLQAQNRAQENLAKKTKEEASATTLKLRDARTAASATERIAESALVLERARLSTLDERLTVAKEVSAEEQKMLALAGADQLAVETAKKKAAENEVKFLEAREERLDQVSDAELKLAEVKEDNARKIAGLERQQAKEQSNAAVKRLRLERAVLKERQGLEAQSRRDLKLQTNREIAAVKSRKGEIAIVQKNRDLALKQLETQKQTAIEIQTVNEALATQQGTLDSILSREGEKLKSIKEQAKQEKAVLGVQREQLENAKALDKARKRSADPISAVLGFAEDVSPTRVRDIVDGQEIPLRQSEIGVSELAQRTETEFGDLLPEESFFDQLGTAVSAEFGLLPTVVGDSFGETFSRRISDAFTPSVDGIIAGAKAVGNAIVDGFNAAVDLFDSAFVAPAKKALSAPVDLLLGSFDSAVGALLDPGQLESEQDEEDQEARREHEQRLAILREEGADQTAIAEEKADFQKSQALVRKERAEGGPEAVLLKQADQAVEFAEKISAALPGLLDKFFTLVIDRLPAVIEAVTGAAVGVIAVIAERLDELLQTVIGVLVKALPNLVQAIAKALGPIVAALINAVVRIIDELPEIIEVLLDGIITALPGVIEAIIVGIPRLIAALIRAIPRIILALIKALPFLLVAVARGLVEGIAGIFKDFFGGIDSFSKIASAVLSALGDWWGEVWKAIKDFFGELFDEAAEVGNAFLGDPDSSGNARLFAGVVTLGGSEVLRGARNLLGFRKGGKVGAGARNPSLASALNAVGAPGFQGGGLVLPDLGQSIQNNLRRGDDTVATLRFGEGVLNPGAMANLGGGGPLAQLNNGDDPAEVFGGGGGQGVVVNITTPTTGIPLVDALSSWVANAMAVSIQTPGSPVRQAMAQGKLPGVKSVRGRS